MSRTTRRLNARYNLHWVLRDTPWIDGQWQRFVLDPNSRAGKKALARYFSDAGLGDTAHATAPRWYRRSLNHSADRREEQERHRWRKNPDHEVVLPRRVSDASGYW